MFVEFGSKPSKEFLCHFNQALNKKMKCGIVLIEVYLEN